MAGGFHKGDMAGFVDNGSNVSEVDLEDIPGDDTSSVHNRRHKTKNRKVCGVCGDRALGYNFNAITCESCKAFFRRNAFKDTQIKCLFSGSCAIDLRTRRFCPACRINKCFEIGMKREMILDETERKARMAKVMHNRAKKQMPTSPQLNPTVKTEPVDPDDFSDRGVGISSTSCHDHNIPPSPSPSPSSSSSTSHYDHQEKVFTPVPAHHFPEDPAMYRMLSKEDQQLLSNMAVCYKTTVTAMPDQSYGKLENYKTADDLVNNSEISVRQLIRFVKQQDDFQGLCQEDQIAALKGSVMPSLLLRSVAFYIVEKDGWLTAKGVIPTSILQEATGFSTLHSKHITYCKGLKSVIQNNFTLYALMQMMLIFQPSSPNLVDRQLVSDLQDKYIRLLKWYLEATFSFQHAQLYFVAMMDKMADLRKLSDHHSRILLQVNPMQIEPLMLEILNLK